MTAQLLTASDFARLAEPPVAPSTVRYWADTRQVPVTRTVSGVRLFRRDHAERFLRRRERRLAEEATRGCEQPALEGTGR